MAPVDYRINSGILNMASTSFSVWVMLLSSSPQAAVHASCMGRLWDVPRFAPRVLASAVLSPVKLFQGSPPPFPWRTRAHQSPAHLLLPRGGEILQERRAPPSLSRSSESPSSGLSPARSFPAQPFLRLYLLEIFDSFRNAEIHSVLLSLCYEWGVRCPPKSSCVKLCRDVWR